MVVAYEGRKFLVGTVRPVYLIFKTNKKKIIHVFFYFENTHFKSEKNRTEKLRICIITLDIVIDYRLFQVCVNFNFLARSIESSSGFLLAVSGCRTFFDFFFTLRYPTSLKFA